ncbi:MAG: outer membrane protein assembly factor BamB family protein [Planctomycetota bacterium]|jgi:outer membrane protein assembly factor BamB
MYRRSAASILVLVLLRFGALAGENGKLTGPEWPQHRGNAGGTGVSPDESVKPPLKLLWSYRCDSDTTGDAGAGLTVGGGKVFCNMEMTKSILALDADTGAFCWEFSNRFVHYTQTSSYADGKLFVWLRYSRNSTLVALDADTGKTVWEKKFGSNQGISWRRFGPAVANGKVLMADGGGEPVIVALDANTGNEVWRTPLEKKDGDVVMVPTIAGGRVFTGTRVKFTRGMKEAVHGAVIALDLKDGKEIWRNRKIYPCLPPVSDGAIVVTKTNREVAMKANPNQKMYVLDAGTGEEIWSVPIKSLYGTTTIMKDTVIQKSYGGGIAALSRKTGEKLWSRHIRTGSGCCSPSVSGKYAYVGTGSYNDSEGEWAWRFATPPHKQKGETGTSWTFHAIDLDTGKTVWEFLTGCNACGDPAIAYGRLYLNSRDGRIYCLEPVKPGEAAASSPEKSAGASAGSVKKLLAEKLPPPRPGRDWPMLGGTPERAGLPVTLNPPLTPAWKLDTGGRVTTAAAIRDGRVFVGSLSGRIIAADLRSGAKVWEFDAGSEVNCSPAVAGGMVYCGAQSGKFFALDAATGEEKWSSQCGGPVEASPAVVGGVVVFGASDHNIYMLDRKTGKKLWCFRGTNQLVGAPPVVKGNQVFAAQWIDWTYALDAATGKEQWRTCVPISIESLHFYNGRLWLRTPRQFAEFDPRDGKRLRLGNLSYGYNGLAFLNDTLIYAGVGSAGSADMKAAGKPSRHEATQPAMKGVKILGTRGLSGGRRLASMGTPLVVGEMVCFASRSGEVSLVKPDPAASAGRYMKAEKIWSFAMGGTCHATPVAADGHLVVGCDDGKLYGFRGK